MIESEAKQFYRSATAQNALPLFLQPWWLDASATPDGWDVTVARRGKLLAAALPFTRKSRYGQTILSVPPLTPFLGPWFAPTGGKSSSRLSREKELAVELIGALPAHAVFQQTFGPHISNWLPWYWAGYSQRTRYTYILDDLSDAERLWAGLAESTRREIRKAQGRFGLTVDTELDLASFLDVNRRTFLRQGLSRPYPDSLVERIDAAAAARGCRQILGARDGSGTIHAVAYLVWDANRTYYLMGGGDPELRTSGAASLVMWEAIRLASAHSQIFDFEGSMLEPVERFFRSFGARQQACLFVWQHHGPLARLYEAWRVLRR